jgi:hypothetical protein
LLSCFQADQMKKLFAIFFLFVFLFNTMGYFIVFEAERYSIKKEIRNNILLGQTDERVSVITINNDQLNKRTSEFELKGDEFMYKGHQYDIIRKESSNNNTTTFYALNDSKEEQLLSSLDNHIQTITDVSKKKHPNDSKNLVKKLSNLYFYFFREMDPMIPTDIIKYQQADLICASADLNTLLLPPKIA